MKKFLLGVVVAFLAACGDTDSDFVQRPEGTSEKSQISSSSGIMWNTEISYGEMTDARDNRTYKTVKIGKQTWMAENLNLKMKGAYCREYDFRKCDVYGRYYDWPTAVGRLDCNYKDTCGVAPVVQGVCPDGWHLPSMEEWNTLVEFVGGDSIAGAKLRSINGWPSDVRDSLGSDDYGFRAIAAGSRQLNPFEEGTYTFYSNRASFWTSTERYKDGAAVVWINNKDETWLRVEKSAGFSIRCVKNSDEFSPDTDEHFEIPQAEIVDFEPGSMTDSRDGQVYRTVTIGSQTWMAENLNYRYTQGTAEQDSSSFCYKQDLDSCAKYGRYYLWSAAMDSAGIFSEDGLGCGDSVSCTPAERVRGVCPEGWHLPDVLDWKVLLDAMGGPYDAAPVLKSTEGWKEDIYDVGNSNGTDDYGFSLWPTGFITCLKTVREYNSNLWNGEMAFLWTSSENDVSNVTRLTVSAFIDAVTLQKGRNPVKNYALPVRCVMD